MKTPITKQFLLSVIVMLTAIVATAQTDQSANYEAAKWDTKLLDNPGQIVAAAAPSAAQSKAELQSVKQRLAKLDDQKLAEIKYWNAGAPSYRWNQIGPKMMSWDQVDIILRFPLAWMNLAVYDATVLAWREKLKYKRKRPQATDPSIKPAINAPSTYSYPCEHSVTASAAAYVLAYFFPQKADSILRLARSASQSRVDAGVQFPSDVEAGWKLGEQVAKQIIEKAKNDGSAKAWTGSINKDPKKWTGPYPLGIKLSLFTPMVMRSVDQFRPPAPPDFENEMQELKNYKRTFKGNSLAYQWANSGIGLWSDLAGKKMFEWGIMNDAPTAARIYALLEIASHEAGIATMDAKYAYWGIRPVQLDTTYKPLLQTPPFPGYPSGHALGAASASTVLTYFFPADAKEFEQMAKDCADSRFYAGIHFRTDNEVGTSMGKEIGKYVVETWMNK